MFVVCYDPLVIWHQPTNHLVLLLSELSIPESWQWFNKIISTMFSLQRPETNQVGWQLETKIFKENKRKKPTNQTRCPPAPNLSCTKVQGKKGADPNHFPIWRVGFYPFSPCRHVQLSNSHVQVSWPFFVSPIWLLARDFCPSHFATIIRSWFLRTLLSVGKAIESFHWRNIRTETLE